MKTISFPREGWFGDFYDFVPLGRIARVSDYSGQVHAPLTSTMTSLLCHDSEKLISKLGGGRTSKGSVTNQCFFSFVVGIKNQLWKKFPLELQNLSANESNDICFWGLQRNVLPPPPLVVWYAKHVRPRWIVIRLSRPVTMSQSHLVWRWGFQVMRRDGDAFIMVLWCWRDASITMLWR